MILPTHRNVIVLLAGLGIAHFLSCGCSRDVRLTGKKLRRPKVETVTLYDVTLDQNASPEQVAYAALRAVAEDFHANDMPARETALDKQFQLAAANEIAKLNSTSLSADEFLFNVVDRWTTSISHYADQFPKSWDDAKPRLIKREIKPGSDPKKAPGGMEVALPVDDPAAHPNAGAVVAVWLAQDSGYWRVSHVGFQQGKRAIVAKAAPQRGAENDTPTSGN